MKETLLTLIAIIITGIAVLLCFSCIFLASQSDEYWEKLRDKLEKKDDERH